MRWRKYADWAKHRPAALRVADRLGRGCGRFRFLDRFWAPPAARIVPDLSGWNNLECAVLWIGHATLLIRIGGLTILTDPVFSNRIGIGLGLLTGGPRRFVAPAVAIHQLPPIDLILISHAHFDHLDRPTLVRLSRRIPIITAPATRDLIDDVGFTDVAELRWGESKQVKSVRIIAQQVAHWGARTFRDAHRGFNAYVLEFGKRRILFGGDSAYQENFRALSKVDLAILGIAAYNPWIEGHATPEQAWEMANHARADFVLPMHHSTFQLSHEPMEEPMERLMAVAGEDGQRVVAREVGEMWMAG